MKEQGKAEMAARLIYLGLDSSINYFDNKEFKELLYEFRTDNSFRILVSDIASGFNLEIIKLNESGIYLRAHENSLFAKDGRNLSPIIKGDDRKYSSFILIALAAYYFPRSASFEEENIHFTEPIKVNELELYIRSKCNQFLKDKKIADPESKDKLIEKLATSYLALKTEETVDSQAVSTVQAKIRKVLDFLVKEKLFIKKEDEFYPNTRFRTQMENLASSPEIKNLIKIFKGESQ